MRRKVGFRVKVALVATFIFLIAGSPRAAWAEGELITATPAAGAALLTAPESVTLTFAKDLWLGQSHLAVLNQAGDNVAGAEPTEQEKRRLWVPVKIDSAGDYTVAYHASFADGTSITGAHRFSSGTGVAPATLDSQMSKAAAEAVTVHPHTIDGFSAVLLVVDGVVLLGAMMLLWLRPRHKRPMSLRAALERED